MKLIEIKQTSPERFTLVFDDGRQIKSSLGVITERFLHSGAELSDAEYDELYSASTLSLAKARALRIINTRPMSRREMYDRLVSKGETTVACPAGIYVVVVDGTPAKVLVK